MTTSYEPFSASKLSSSSSYYVSWILDMGASYYITYGPDKLISKIPYSENKRIILENGDKIYIVSVGSSKLNTINDCVLSLKYILYTPLIFVNFLYGNKICVDNQVSIYLN